MNDHIPRKARRITRACDYCHQRSIRCRLSREDPSRCQNCNDYRQACTYERPLKKRGVRPSYGQARAAATSHHAHQYTGDATNGGWRAPEIATQALVMDLVEIYFEIVYPIFPFFHQPTTLKRVARGEYQFDRPFFAAIMAMCAIASARARDGATFSGNWDLNTLRQPPSEVFFSASTDNLPRDSKQGIPLDYMRACALLSITSIQYGQHRSMLEYLGLYHTMVEIDGLHDEKNWPTGARTIEIEERRRLFWSIYTLDVYTAIAWGRIVRSRESQSNVAYPSTLEDAMITNENYQSDSITSPLTNVSATAANPLDSRPMRWMHGWNFTTDLYRILEHALDSFRRRHPQSTLRSSIEAIFGDIPPTEATVLDAILNMYQGLPARFKETPAVSETNSIEHRLNFQTANIAATIQLVRMVLFAAEDATVEQKCCTASELLRAFSDVPAIYLRAISSPLLHHLESIGLVLGSVFEKPLHESSYRQVRSVLVSIVQLLSDLEINIFCKPGTSTRLKILIERIDSYMQIQRSLSQLDTQEQEPTNEEGQESLESGVVSASGSSPLFMFPPELLEDWSWAFDFTQSSA
ncbi:hypothetical protein K491DRAFT_691021 [Lophiostoma macrostomum CBS 122681]|uniref:Zn(2)-C6 fungal-type domain-containing protein n=1 Tax=Lophiostoma macrostomum CBS 122681 TaxID=1314788 RepID=A0A6A6TCN4_9PLEO|nr:hypothetical protein K491DRAFT_691021 [Lophiostoma macrostomum CBS 122681]